MPESPKIKGSNSRIGTLEFGDFPERIERRVGKQIGRRLIMAE